MAEGRAGPPRRAVKASEPMVLAISGRRWFPLYAVMRHRGRKSGTEYETPIAVIPTARRDIVLIGLPWGATTNWARNVEAAGRASLRWKGRDHELTEPRIITGSDAAALAKPVFRGAVRRMPAAILLKRSMPG